jgi:integrase
LKEEAYDRVIFTVDEVCKFLPADWSFVWKSHSIFMANRLAACTGMRIGELRGLRAEHIFDDYIYVCGQYTRYGYKPMTKTKDNRKIPITPLIRREIGDLIKANGDGYIFSEDGGGTPVPVERIGRQFESALKKIGISVNEKNERNLTFHAWRHFFNTYLRMNNIADSKVQSVTGHRSREMTEHYTHFDTRQFTEVRDVQNELLALPDNTVKKLEEKMEDKTAARKKTATKKSPVVKRKTA